MLRVNIIDRANDIKCECLLADELSLRENLNLYKALNHCKNELKYVYAKESNFALDFDVSLKEFNFIDGQILIFY